MVSVSFSQTAQCRCKQSKISVKAKPFARFKCHCTICQKLYNKPYAEFVVVNAKDVCLDKCDQIKFGKYRRPPALSRGLCQGCDSPLIAFLRLAPFIKLAFIPIERFNNADELPGPLGHIFYHSRTQDIEDDLPKVSGYWKSELTVTRAVLKGLINQ